MRWVTSSLPLAYTITEDDNCRETSKTEQAWLVTYHTYLIKNKHRSESRTYIILYLVYKLQHSWGIAGRVGAQRLVVVVVVVVEIAVAVAAAAAVVVVIVVAVVVAAVVDVVV
ncbi:hypothetical protein ElyMa_001384000 [Elysia marginata]|uniref:Uncharacterized protein n=1 Tax=Elysia marginata TaxID=1093978 RepID=A0AAV4IU51_9GAST|nr:hypothetical protein ElyMa_001384000 [Elysia marginata]